MEALIAFAGMLLLCVLLFSSSSGEDLSIDHSVDINVQATVTVPES